jgi:peptidoglycan hydrolase CwlO-like protein
LQKEVTVEAEQMRELSEQRQTAYVTLTEQKVTLEKSFTDVKAQVSSLQADKAHLHKELEANCVASAASRSDLNAKIASLDSCLLEARRSQDELRIELKHV